MRLQALQAEAIAEQKQPAVKPLASYFSSSAKATRAARVATKPGV